jgi:hypothetical protein
MVLRGADYPREPDEHYQTPAEPVRALIPLLSNIAAAWIPSDRGRNSMIATILRSHSIETVSTDIDFFNTREPPSDIDGIVDNPPYGTGGRQAVAFAEHALQLVPFIALLLPVDFDSGRTRSHLFRDCPSFAGRLILLQRPVWFPGGPAGPSANFVWLIWNRAHSGPPTVHYEAETNLRTRKRSVQMKGDRSDAQARDANTSSCAPADSRRLP